LTELKRRLGIQKGRVKMTLQLLLEKKEKIKLYGNLQLEIKATDLLKLTVTAITKEINELILKINIQIREAKRLDKLFKSKKRCVKPGKTVVPGETKTGASSLFMSFTSSTLLLTILI